MNLATTKSLHHAAKRETIESFLRFSQGREMPKWPLEVFLEISNLCDLKCAMCHTFSALNPQRYNAIRRSERGMMDIEDGTEPMESLLQHALLVHAFGFGEPTIHPQFKEFLSYLSQYEVMIDFFSNGMHLDENLARFLVQQRIMRITISFSGATKEEYENVYLGGNFEQVLDGIERVTAEKERAGTSFPVIEINSIAFNHQVEKFPQFVTLMGERGANVIHLKPLQTYDTIKELHGHISVPREHIEIPLIQEAKKIGKKYGVLVATRPYEAMTISQDESLEQARKLKHRGQKEISMTYVPIEQLKHLASEKALTKKKPKGAVSAPSPSQVMDENVEFMPWEQGPCFEPFKTVYASFNGDIYPCCFRKRGQALGSLKNNSGEEIWRNATFTKIREQVIEHREYPKELCESCLRAKTYPVHHAFGNHVQRYGKWYEEAFNAEFDRRLRDAAKKVGENEEFYEAFAAAKQAGSSGKRRWMERIFASIGG